MTEKKFVCHPTVCGVHIGVGLVDDEELTGDECRDLLNQLNDENEELKNNCKNYTWYKEYKKLLNENEELKKQKKVLIDYMDNWCPKRVYDAIMKRMDEVE